MKTLAVCTVDPNIVADPSFTAITTMGAVADQPVAVVAAACARIVMNCRG